MTPPLTDDRVINDLINFYRSKGLNVTGVLDNPIFTSLSTQTKVQIIKNHAEALSTGGHGLTSAEKRGLAVSAAIRAVEGAALGIAASKAVSAARGDPYHGGYGVSAGAAFGLVGGLGALAYKAMKIQARRKTSEDAMRLVHANPSDATALAALFRAVPIAAPLNPADDVANVLSNKFLATMQGRIKPLVEEAYEIRYPTPPPTPPQP